MTQLLNKKGKGQVASVAFGEDWNSYFVVFANGGYEGCDVPGALQDLLNRRGKRGDLDCVSLGPDGEYYLKAKNGRTWWGGMTDERMKQVGKHRGRITFLDFGDDGAFLARYN